MRISRLQGDRGHVTNFDAYDVLLQGHVMGNAKSITWRIGPVLIADEEAGAIFAYATHAREGHFVLRPARDQPETDTHRMMDARCDFRVFMFEGHVEIRRRAEQLVPA